MAATVFNPAQIHLLEMFSRIKTEKELDEVRQVLAEYYNQKLQKELDKAWQTGAISQEKLDELDKVDIHKWLREQRAVDAIV